MTVVEEPAVPLLVSAPCTLVEVLVISAVELVQRIKDILGGVTVDNIKKNHESHTVGSIDKLLQVLWGAITAASCKEIVDLITETGIVGVLHDSHELDDIVTESLDPGKHVLGEFFVCGDLELR